MTGSLANGFFASKSVNSKGQGGLVDGRAIQIAYQLLGKAGNVFFFLTRGSGILLSMAWSGLWSFVILKVLGYAFGGIRVSVEAERDGLGWADHGEVRFFFPKKLTHVVHG